MLRDNASSTLPLRMMGYGSAIGALVTPNITVELLLSNPHQLQEDLLSKLEGPESAGSPSGFQKTL